MDKLATIKAVFFDIDGTLFRKETGILPASVTPALKALKSSGVMVAIATGRSEPIFPELIRALIDEVGIDLLVSTNGQYVSYQGQKLVEYTVSTEEIEQMLPVIQSYGLMHGFVSREHLVTSIDHEAIRSALYHVGEYIIAPDYYQNHAIHQLVLFADKQFDLALAQEPELTGYKLVPWRKNAYDLLPEQASKTRGIMAAVDKLGIKREEIMAFGDGLNDLEMIDYAGVGIAMSDSHADLLAIADTTTATLEEDGIAKALIRYGLI